MVVSTGPAALVCDSDAVSARFVARALTRAGLDVATCDTAAACEARVTERAPALVVLSILLPDLDGLALTRRLRGIRDARPDGHPKLVVASVLQATQRALEAGADAFLLKPVEPAALAALCTRLLGAGGNEPAGGNWRTRTRRHSATDGR